MGGVAKVVNLLLRIQPAHDHLYRNIAEPVRQCRVDGKRRGRAWEMAHLHSREAPDERDLFRFFFDDDVIAQGHAKGNGSGGHCLSPFVVRTRFALAWMRRRDHRSSKKGEIWQTKPGSTS